MDKKVYNAVNNRANGECENCHEYFANRLELHHINRRKVNATVDNCKMLCYECHRGTNGVHGKYGHILDVDLRLGLQQLYYSKGITENYVRILMGGKIWSEDDYFSKGDIK